MRRKLNFEQTSGLAGVGFAVTIVLVNIIVLPGGPPLPGADFGEVSRFFGERGGTQFAVASALTPLAWVFATVFGAGVVSAPRLTGWSLVGFAGLIAQNVTFCGVVAIRLAFATTPGDATLWAMHDALFTINGAFLGIALVGFSLGGRRAGLVRGWHANLGLVSAVLLFASALLTPVIIDRTGPLGLVALVGWLMWVVWFATYGIVLFQQKRPTPMTRESASAT